MINFTQAVIFRKVDIIELTGNRCFSLAPIKNGILCLPVKGGLGRNQNGWIINLRQRDCWQGRSRHRHFFCRCNHRLRIWPLSTRLISCQMPTKRHSHRRWHALASKSRPIRLMDVHNTRVVLPSWCVCGYLY